MANVTVNGNSYNGVTEVQLPITDSNAKQRFVLPPAGTVQITQNGTHDVRAYENALVQVEGDAPETQSRTVTPTAAGLTVTPDSGKLLSEVVINGDADLVSGNIKSGVEIFGVVGTYEGDGGGSSAGASPFITQGNPVICTPVAGTPLDVAVNVVPQQAAGTPTPSNPIPIVVPESLMVHRHGKNRFDGSTYNVSGISNNGDGSYTATADKFYKTPIYFNNDLIGTTLTVSATITTTNLPTKTYWRKTENGVETVLDQVYVANSTTGRISVTLTPQNADDCVKIAYNTGYSSIITVSDIQIEIGSVATAYEPYAGDGDSYMINLPSGFARGEVDVTGGSITQTWGKIVLDGTENFNMEQSDANAGYIYHYTILPYNADSSHEIIASIGNFQYAYAGNCIFANARGLIFGRDFCINNGFTSVAAFKSYLAAQYAAGTPVTICYRLAAPIETEITPLQISALAGTNTLSTNGTRLTVSGVAHGASVATGMLRYNVPVTLPFVPDVVLLTAPNDAVLSRYSETSMSCVPMWALNFAGSSVSMASNYAGNYTSGNYYELCLYAELDGTVLTLNDSYDAPANLNSIDFVYRALKY